MQASDDRKQLMAFVKQSTSLPSYLFLKAAQDGFSHLFNKPHDNYLYWIFVHDEPIRA